MSYQRLLRGDEKGRGGVMEITRLPVLDGADTENAIAQLKGYVIRLDRQLSVLLSGIGENDLSPALKSRIFGSAERQTGALKNEIIETAQQIRELSDRLELKLRSEYVAKGEVGQYAEQAFHNITVDGKGVTQYFEEIQSLSERLDGAQTESSEALEAFRTELKSLSAYIRTGKLADGVYGIEIGSLGEGVTPYKVRLSDNRLSFFVGGEEAAYFSDNSMYISRANVPLMLTVGGCVMKSDRGLSLTAE